jgi:hypothetical protein
MKERAAERSVSIDEYVNEALRDLTGGADPDAPEPGSLSGAEMIQYWERVGAFSDQPLTEDSVDIVNRMRRQSGDRWKS